MARVEFRVLQGHFASSKTGGLPQAAMSMRLPVCALPASHPVPTHTGQNCFSPSQAGIYILKCLELHQYENLVISENSISFRAHFVPLSLLYYFLVY